MDAWVGVFRNGLSEWMRGSRNGCVGSSLSEQSFGMDAWVEGLSVKSLSEIPKVDAPVDGWVFGLSERSFGMWMVAFEVDGRVFGLSERSFGMWMVGFEVDGRVFGLSEQSFGMWTPPPSAEKRRNCGRCFELLE